VILDSGRHAVAAGRATTTGVHWEAGAPMIKKYLTWALGAFVIFYLLKSPSGAADVVHNALGTLSNAGDSLSRFVNAL
jgi:hypothetical protein